MPSFVKLKFESASWARGPAQLRQDDFFFFFPYFSPFLGFSRKRLGLGRVLISSLSLQVVFYFLSSFSLPILLGNPRRFPLNSRQRRQLQQLLLLEALLQGSKTAPSNPERDILFCSTMAGTEQKHPREKLAWLPCLKLYYRPLPGKRMKRENR